MKKATVITTVCLAGFVYAAGSPADGRNAIWGTDGAGITKQPTSSQPSVVIPMDPEKQTIKQTQQQLEGTPRVVKPDTPTEAITGQGTITGKNPPPPK